MAVTQPATGFPAVFDTGVTPGAATGEYGNTFTGSPTYGVKITPRDGADMFFFVQPLNNQMLVLETNMQTIMNNANLSDVQKQFQLQQAVNSWSAIAQGMTAMIKSVGDVCSSIAHNMNT
jgi:hypothetical protein